MQSFDIIIVGGGIVGLTLACALMQKTSLSIAVIDSRALNENWQSSTYHSRVSAITLASKHIFQNLQIWDEIAAKRVSPFEEIKIWDEAANSMQFSSREIAEPVLGYIIENNLMLSVLLKKLKQAVNVKIIECVDLKEIVTADDYIQLIAANNEVYQAKLAVAADGANSWLRQQAKIEVRDLDYAQTAIVAAVTSELPHNRVARQVFLKTGPLAFLPLADANTTSIVWSLPMEEAAIVKNLSTEMFQAELNQAFQNRLGEIRHISERFYFPLHQQYATRYAANRVVLVGDAAHIVHPLAGQGVNMGLLDAASLFDVLHEAIINKRDFAHYAVLRKYERWRRADNLLMFNGIKAIKSLFATQNIFLKRMRTLGMKMTDRIQWMKTLLIKYAVGTREGLPNLAKDFYFHC